MVGVAIAINADVGAPAYAAGAWRQAAAVALQYDGRAVGGRQGVRPGGDQLLVSLAGSTITVAPGVAVLDPGLTTTQGPYWVAIPVAEAHTLDPADATNPRKDIIILRVYDHDEDLSGQRLVQTEYLVGVPNPVPAEPAVPAGAIRLATIDVPASPGAPVVTDRRPWTVAPGGILPVNSQAERDALAPYEALTVYRRDLTRRRIEIYDGGTWQPFKFTEARIQVRNNVAQSIPHDAETVVTYNTTDYNVGFGVAGGAITVPESAEYVVSASMRFASNATGHRRISLYRLGTLVCDDMAPAISGFVHGLSVQTVISLSEGSTIEARVYQNSGAALNTAPTSITPQLVIRKLA